MSCFIPNESQVWKIKRSSLRDSNLGYLAGMKILLTSVRLRHLIFQYKHANGSRS